MAWLQNNWLWLLFIIGLLAMHMFGHGSHGSHGSHERRDHEGGDDWQHEHDKAARSHPPAPGPTSSFEVKGSDDG